MAGSTGRKRVPENVLLDLPIPAIQPDDQTAISDALEMIQRASAAEANCEQMAQDLKRAAMRDLFTRGLRGEPQKETEIGLVPEIWDVVLLGSLGRVGNGSTPKRSIPEYWNGGDNSLLNRRQVQYPENVIAGQDTNEEAAREQNQT